MGYDVTWAQLSLVSIYISPNITVPSMGYDVTWAQLSLVSIYISPNCHRWLSINGLKGPSQKWLRWRSHFWGSVHTIHVQSSVKYLRCLGIMGKKIGCRNIWWFPFFKIWSRFQGISILISVSLFWNTLYNYTHHGSTSTKVCNLYMYVARYKTLHNVHVYRSYTCRYVYV